MGENERALNEYPLLKHYYNKEEQSGGFSPDSPVSKTETPRSVSSRDISENLYVHYSDFLFDTLPSNTGENYL